MIKTSQQLIFELEKEIESLQNPIILTSKDKDNSLCGQFECLNSGECQLIDVNCKHLS
jgi:hypothetical protein